MNFNGKIETINTLIQNQNGIEASVALRTLVEQMIKVMIVDKGLWESVSRNSKNNIILMAAIDKLKNKRQITPLQCLYFQNAITIGNEAAHGGTVNTNDTILIKNGIFEFLEEFRVRYPDECYFHNIEELSIPLINVTSTFNGRKINVKSVQNGYYISAILDDPRTPVFCRAKEALEWEQFLVQVNDDGWAGFKNFNEKWMTVNNDSVEGVVTANVSDLSTWESFKIYKNNDNFYIYSRIKNKWLSVSMHQDNYPILANGLKPSDWELMRIRII